MARHGNSKSTASKSTVIGIIAIIIIIALVVSVVLYKNSKTKLLDKTMFNSFAESIEENASKFKSNDDLKNFITKWADKNKAEYTVDSGSNIIFEHSADEGKTDIKPTVICVNYNYRNALYNANLLATAACCAASDLDSGKYTVIFFNNDLNLASGYSDISRDYFPDNAQVIYLDYGKNTSISRNSFGMNNSCIDMPAQIEDAKYDTAINIRISGIETNDINDSIASQPNPVSILSTILQRLNTKSISYQLASISMPSSGNMYPEVLDATILINSYSQQTVTDYIDERIDEFDKKYSDSNPNASFEYKVISDEAELPVKAFTEATSDSLNTLLFTINNGAYRYNDDDVPENAEVGDIYALNTITEISFSENNISINITSSGKNNAIVKKVSDENSKAAELAGSSIRETYNISPFKNQQDLLYNELQVTYIKVNDFSGPELLIKKDDDRYFNSCSYLQQINPNMDIVHMRSDSDSVKTIASTVLCFIQVQGKFLKL